MDPVSIISFVSAIAGIVDVITKGARSLSDLQSRYRIADLKVSLLIGQFSTLKAALTQIGYLVEDISQAPRDTQLVSDLSVSLSSLETIIGALDNRLSQLSRNAEDGLSNWAKVNFVWDEQTMRDYLSLLDCQVNALGLLLSALQCRTTLEQSDMLRTRESRHVLQLARDETSSMRWLTDSDSITSSLQSVGTQDLETVHTRFDFDSELFTSKAYQVASRANMIDALMGSRRNGVSHSTEITSSPVADTSGSNGSSQVPHTGIALTTVVDIVSDCASDILHVPALSRGDITGTEPQTCPTTLVGTRDSDVQLPDYVIHPPESLGLLALQLGEPPSSLVPNTRIQIRAGLLKASTKLPLLFRSKKQVVAPFPIANIPVHSLVKILILGISESGKTTLAKTMRAGHGDIDKAWLRLYRGTIVDNVILSLKWLLFVAHQTDNGALLSPLENLWDAEAFFANARVIGKLEVDGFPKASTLATIASAAQFLWSHPYIRQVYKSSSTAQRPIAQGKHLDLPLYLPDCTEHFLDSIERIFKKDYLPSLEDVLWAQTRTTGSWESRFVINGGTYQLFDVGGARSEQRKWITAFDAINMIIFTIDLSCYHQALNEDISTNRMEEQFRLWESIANSDWFASARIIVLFTKGDKLTSDRLRRHPFGEEFADFVGDPDSADDIIKYITWRLDGLLNRKGNVSSGRITFCRSGTISESLKVWETMFSVQGNVF